MLSGILEKRKPCLAGNELRLQRIGMFTEISLSTKCLAFLMDDYTAKNTQGRANSKSVPTFIHSSNTELPNQAAGRLGAMNDGMTLCTL